MSASEKTMLLQNMRTKSQVVFSIFFLLFIHVYPSESSCPINFTYVETFPWDTSPCHEKLHPSCCQTLRGVFGMGIGQYLKQTSMFYLPDSETSSSCLSDFQKKLESLSIYSSLFHQCFNDTAEFANRNSSCDGIRTVSDWKQKVNVSNSLESSCNGDLTGMVRCGLCLDAGLQVNSYLLSLQPNSTKCFFFVVFYAAAVVNDLGPEDPRVVSCMLRLPISTNVRKSKNNNRVRLVSGMVGGVSGICMAIVLFLVYRKWAKKKKQDMLHKHYVLSVQSRVLPNTGAKWFNISELEQATDGFLDKNVIGRGGFGVVYKGTLLDGTEVAVKQVLDLESQGDEEFTNEAEIISKIRHRNLLSLRGFCATSERFHGKRRYLVYDYMSNGSLDDHLFTKNGNNKNPLSWPQRKNIILDVAKGLAYLHNGIKPAVYHRDIKATNILLDSDMRAKVADFGLAKQNSDGQSHVTTRVAGTHGYLAPEYALYGHLTEKTDVYSFGILILEIVSGRKVLDVSGPRKKLITDWAWEVLKSGRVEEIFHESIRKEGPKGVMERFMRVGILCAHVMMAFRPTIAEALRMLEGDIDVPELPDRPLPLSYEVLDTSFGYSTLTMTKESKDASSISSTSRKI